MNTSTKPECWPCSAELKVVCQCGEILTIKQTAAINTHRDQGTQVTVEKHECSRALISQHEVKINDKDGASASAPTQNVTDKGSVQHETDEVLRMLTLRKELDPDAPDAIVFPESVSSSSISSTLAEIRERRSKISPTPWEADLDVFDESGEFAACVSNKSTDFLFTSETAVKNDATSASYEAGCATQEFQDATFIANAPTDIDTLRSIIDSLQAERNAFWAMLHRCWDIEPRSYFEEQAPKNGFDYAPAMAVHYMWKRDTNTTEAASNMKAELIKRVRERAIMQRRHLSDVGFALDQLATELEAVELPK